MRWVLAVACGLCLPLAAGTGADVVRGIRENSFDPDQCYRVRDLSIIKGDLKIYLTDGHLIFAKPVAGRRIAAVFTADVEGGDGEVILLPPNRAERTSLAAYIDTPNLDDHFRAALFIFTGADYDALLSQLPNNPANHKDPAAAAALDQAWAPSLQNLAAGFQARLVLDLAGGAAARSGFFAGLFSSPKLGAFEVIFDPFAREQMTAGQVNSRDDRFYFDTWTSFEARSFRNAPAVGREDVRLSDYRIQATVNPDLTVDAVTRIKVKSSADGLAAVTFEITPQMAVTAVTVDGRPAEVLQRDTLRASVTPNGNDLFLVFPPEPLRAGREYEFEFHHSGKVIVDAGERVFFVTARGNWYPMHNFQFANYDIQFRYPRDLDLVAAGDVVEEANDGDWRVTRRRTAAPIRFAAFNLGNFEHVRVESSNLVIDVCANRALERAFEPKTLDVVTVPAAPGKPRRADPTVELTTPAPHDPLERLQTLASEVVSAIEFMVAKFGPPALPHITVSPIPGTFGQGFPGLIYLSTLSYLKSRPAGNGTLAQSQALYFDDLLEAHEVAHQWWGNRVTASFYRDAWLMESAANFSALLYMEKSKGPHSTDVMLDSYRNLLLEKTQGGQTVESLGPIVFGLRLESSQLPSAYRTITYGKGTWIMQMLRRRMGDERFGAMLAEVLKRYDRRDITTEEFRALAAQFLPARSEDPQLTSFFDQWVYGTGIPTLKLSWAVKGKAPDVRLVGTVTQADVVADFTALVPVEIQPAHGPAITRWVRTSSDPVAFTVPLNQAPAKVVLDPHNAVLRR
ncbi:MAG: M1 family aminopeptidase [Bryobacteraceae bacterium]